MRNKPLSAQQLKHYTARVNRIKATAFRTLHALCTTPEKKLSEREIYFLVKKGAVKLKPEKDIEFGLYHNDLRNFFDLSAYEHREIRSPDYEIYARLIDLSAEKALDDVIFIKRAEDAPDRLVSLEEDLSCYLKDAEDIVKQGKK